MYLLTIHKLGNLTVSLKTSKHVKNVHLMHLLIIYFLH